MSNLKLIKLDGIYERLEIDSEGLTQVILEVPQSNAEKKLDVVLTREGAEAEILGVYLGTASQKVELVVNSVHEAPNTKCLTQIRGVLKDESFSSFKGLIIIKKGAQKTNSYLDHDVLILGEKARNQSEPGLEIEADDVRATHGSTTGRILESHLFYLMSRGLSRQESENLIVGGFLSPVVDRIKDESAKNKIALMLLSTDSQSLK